MPWVYFCVYGDFHQGGINKKVLPKAGVVGKNMKREDGHMGGVVYRRRISNLLHSMDGAFCKNCC